MVTYNSDYTLLHLSGKVQLLGLHKGLWGISLQTEILSGDKDKAGKKRGEIFITEGLPCLTYFTYSFLYFKQ